MKNPFVIILSGVPLSGKSTWVEKNYPGVMVISRDNILMEISNTKDYNKAYKESDSDLVDKILNERIFLASKSGDNVIIDMVHASKKSRRRSLTNFSKKYYKIGVSFPFLSKDEYIRRNNLRKEKENKFIPDDVLQNMIESFVNISYEEDFNEIIEIKL